MFQSPSQDAEWSPNLTINHIPDELLLEIFDSYRQAIDHYDQEWSREYVWFNLAHVCRKWCAVMFASVSRLDLGISVGPEKPVQINTILSCPWPIFIDYMLMYRDITGIALLRMRAVLMHHHDHVRKISFGGTRASFDEFFNVANRAFPFLESLSLDFYDDYEPKIHFLGDQTYQICIYDVSVFTVASPSHPYPDFYCLQRLSPTSVCYSVIQPSGHHQKRPFSPVYKACLAYAVSTCSYHCSVLSTPRRSLQLPRLSFYSQN